MKSEKICPVKRINNDRLKILLFNTLTFLNTEYFEGLTLDEKLEILIYELGFTENEIISLNLVEEVLGDDTGRGNI